MRVCPKCERDEFKTRFGSEKNRNNKCLECQNAYRRQHYIDNKEKYLAKAKRWNQQQREWLAEYKRSRPCVDCEQFFNPWQMQFDHLEDKAFDISSAITSKSREAILKEIEKCDLVCANCHADRTYKRSTEITSVA